MREAQQIANRTLLTEKQAEVWVLHKRGLTQSQIADQLGSNPSTIGTHLSRVREKVQLARETGAEIGEMVLLDETASDVQAPNFAGLSWEPWRPFDEVSSPEKPGIYRVRHKEFDGWIYTGESEAVKRRIHQLMRGVLGDERPYKDPHVAAPTCWDIAEEYGEMFEVSYTRPIGVGDLSTRRGIEHSLIALHRREVGRSPVAQFSGVLPGRQQAPYRRNAEGQEETNNDGDHHIPSVEPSDWIQMDRVTGRRWMGYEWSTPRPLRQRSELPRPEQALCIVWKPNRDTLDYVTATTDVAGALYRLENTYGAESLVSIADISEKATAKRHRRELKSELIGVHTIACGTSPPRFQFVKQDPPEELSDE